MFPRKFHVCDLFGIPVYLDVTTVVLLFFFIGMTGSFALDLASALLLLVSIVVHELAHALTARSFGCETHDVTLSFIGGCASLERIPRKAWQEFLVAAAGPAASFALAVVGYVVCRICRDPFLAKALGIGAILNFTLGAFNLLPGFPMDGGRIFRSAMRAFMDRARATKTAMIMGRAAAVLLVLGPAFGIHHIWIIPVGGNFFLRVFIAWMIWKEGWREYQQALAEESWRGWGAWARVSPPPYGGDEDDAEVSSSRRRR